ncbi:MAG: biotin-dependent carboxyltransferase family protein [Bacteroidota bacterium]
MPTLEIIQPGLLTTVQDRGREGMRKFAIPSAGVMDPEAAAIALLLLRADRDAPVLECTAQAPVIRFHGAARIALTGADFQWTLGGRPVPLNQVLEVADGMVLAGKSAQQGFRGYIAVAGQWQGKALYGSHSTWLEGKFGGVEGRRLQKEDRLEWKPEIAQWTADEGMGTALIALRKGPEYGWLSVAGRATLVGAAFTVRVDSNRMGARLQGPEVECKAYGLAASAPVLPGFVQVPPSGQPIVVLQDGQVTAG